MAIEKTTITKNIFKKKPLTLQVAIIAIIVLGLIGCLAGYFIFANKTEASTIIIASDSSFKENTAKDVIEEKNAVSNENLVPAASSDTNPVINSLYKKVSVIASITGGLFILLGVINFIKGFYYQEPDDESRSNGIMYIFLGMILMGVRILVVLL